MNARSPGQELKECDLVMKGGITSGVVYPQAVLALKDRYRFRSIGGGSVGAVAAALTAAAEFGRECGGFEKLENEQKKLQKKGFLLEVFWPSASTRPLMKTLLDLSSLLDLRKKEQRGRVWLFRKSKAVLKDNNPGAYRKGRLVAAALGAVAGVILGALLAVVLGAILYVLFFVVAGQGLDSLGGWLLILPLLVFGPALVLGISLGLLFRWIGGPVGGVYSLYRVLTREMPERNFYGLCVGSGEPGTSGHPLLTDWLSGLLDDLANLRGEGIEVPLTFRHLKDKEIAGKRPDEPAIALRMLTTNLNHQEPYLFPREPNTFLFSEREMREFFPGYVVDYMVRNAALAGELLLPDGYHFLPQGEDLPIIVPVRMGLSFPVLLSTVPLYTIKESSWDSYRKSPYRLHEKRDLQRNLFSDGGICSNFPIHFFDVWLPEHPTFGIDLTSAIETDGAEVDEKPSFSASEIHRRASQRGDATRTARSDGSMEPWLPKPDDPDSHLWTRFDNLIGFGRAILSSAMNYRDNMQTRLPSYQERVVRVPLREGEGGLNLGMDPEVVHRLECRGREAGERLAEGFEGTGFERHRWVRLRVLMNQLETQLEEMREALDKVIDEDLLQKQLDENFPYHLPADRIKKARKLLKRLDKLAGALGDLRRDREVTSTGAPDVFPPLPEDPQPNLRVTPDV